jgi:hypothetical protein
MSTSSDLLALSLPRLARHRLHPVAPVGTGLAEVAAGMAGVHAQVLSAAETSLAIRVDGATRADVRAALWEERSLVKTYGPRGTVHLLSTTDLPYWTAALSSIPWHSPHAQNVRMDDGQTDLVVAAIADALADSELTVDELTEAVVQRVGPWAGERVMPAFQDQWPRWRQATAVAAHRGVLCFGPDRRRRVTYTNPRRWVPAVEPVKADEAARWLAGEWLAAYGPGGAEELARWLGAPTSWATKALDGARRGEVPAVADRAPAALLLPYFDAYVVGFRPRPLLFPGPAWDRALTPSGQAGNYPVLLVDGVVAGVWHSRRVGSMVHVTVETLRDLTADELDAVEQLVLRLGQVLEARPTLTFGPVTVGGHA